MLTTLMTATLDEIRAKEKLGGFVVKRDGSLLDTFDEKTIYAHMSEPLIETLFDHRGDDVYMDVTQGEVVGLVGQIALPCVCEVPPSSAELFSEESAKVVSQGITWQSLYLVILGRHFVLAEPEKASRGNGRVITKCKLESLAAERDAPDARADTAARRLILAHSNFDTASPGLFLFGTPPKVKDEGAFIRQQQFRSSLDIWFEDNRAVSMATRKMDENIQKAKIYRGMRLFRYLSQGEDSGYPTSRFL